MRLICYQLFCHVGPSCFALFAPDDVPEFVDLTSKLVFCFSPMAYSDNICLDLAPMSKYDGRVLATHCQTHTIKVPVSHTALVLKFWSLDLKVLVLIVICEFEKCDFTFVCSANVDELTCDPHAAH